MKLRMLCTRCGALTHPDTLLEGSDLLEMLGWVLGIVPGWLYCAWRHTLRVKACPFCRSRELMRESRAAAARVRPAAPSPAATYVANLRGPVHWPRALRLPRVRLRLGAALALVSLALLATWAVGPGGSPSEIALGSGLSAAGGFWLLREVRRTSRTQALLTGAAAWDARGRPLRIELV